MYYVPKEQSSLTHHDVGALHGHVEGRVVGGEALGAADEGGGRSRGEGIGRSGEGGNEGENGLHLDGYNATGGMSWSASRHHRASFDSTYGSSYILTVDGQTFWSRIQIEQTAICTTRATMER